MRTFSPINITSPDLTAYNNVLNSFRNKGTSFLLGLKRLSRFGATVIAPLGTHYTYKLDYTGSVPERQRFALRDTASGIII